MCKNSEELQKLWQLKASDYALKNSSREIFLLSGKENKNDYIWLPVQHQLEKLSRKFGVLNWIKYDNYCAGFWDYFLNLYKNHPTKEMCVKHATKYTAYLDLSLLHKIRGNKSIHKLYMEKACESFPFFQELILKRFFNLI